MGDGGELYDVSTLTPKRVIVQGGSYIGSDGVEPITLLEVQGEYYGLPYRFALEFSHESAVRIGASLLKFGTEPPAANLNDVLAAMVAHGADNPTHGFNCSCKDEYLRAARRMLTPDMINELRYLTLVVAR